MPLLLRFIVISLFISLVLPVQADTKPTDGGMLQAVSLSEMNDWIRTAMKKRITVQQHEARVLNNSVRSRIVRPMAKAVSANSRFSTTNTQEQGVDEADLVKTDGRYLFALNRERIGKAKQSLRVMDTRYQGDKLRQVAYVGFGDAINLQGMYFAEKQQMLVVVGNAYSRQGNATHLIYIDVKDRYKPKILQRIKLDGAQRSSRRVGDTLYLTLSNWLQLPKTYQSVQRKTPLTEREKNIYKQRLDDGINRWNISTRLPMYTAVGNKKPLPLITNKQFFMDRGNPEPIFNMTVLMAIDLKSSDFRFNSKAYFGYTGSFYASAKALYLSSHYYQGLLNKPLPVSGAVIHKFSYQGLNIDYRGSAVVPGQFKRNDMSSFQMDENQAGHLRVVTYNAASLNRSALDAKIPDSNIKHVLQRSPVIVTVLSEHPSRKKLLTLSQLPNEKYPNPLGKPGEQLYGSRLFEDYAYFVTFRNTDPLYVVDLRNSWDIKVTGELLIPGFSDYLHPIGSRLLLGIGKSANQTNGRTQGLKLSLFDINDPRQPKEVDVMSIGKAGTFSPANTDHHAVMVLRRSDSITRLALPISVPVAASSNSSRTNKTGLHRFEINEKTKKIIAKGVMTPPDNGWSSAWSDRSIMIDEILYYYHNNQFWAQSWQGDVQEKLIGR